MTDQHNQTDMDQEAWLKAHFDAARRTAPEPDAAFLQKIMDEADNTQEGWSETAHDPAPALQPYKGRLTNVLQALGGWPAAASLSTATVLGIWIGVAPPDNLAGVAQAWMQGETVLLDTGSDDAFYLFGETL